MFRRDIEIKHLDSKILNCLLMQLCRLWDLDYQIVKLLFFKRQVEQTIPIRCMYVTLEFNKNRNKSLNTLK